VGDRSSDVPGRYLDAEGRPAGSGQQFIGWKHEAVNELTDVDDISEAIEWANARVREASAIDGIHHAVSTLYVVLPPEITGAGIVQIHGVNPTRGD
jgi:hypothetical protein